MKGIKIEGFTEHLTREEAVERFREKYPKNRILAIWPHILVSERKICWKISYARGQTA